MSVTVQLPAELSRHCQGLTTNELSGKTVGEVLDNLWQRFPNLQERMVNPDGVLWPYLMLLHNGNRLAAEGYRDIVVTDGDRLEIESLATGG